MAKNRIDIYVGVIGSAYVDKEKALVDLNRAKQNVQDWTDIAEDIDTLKELANDAKNRAQNTQGNVAELLETLNDIIASATNNVVKNKLEELKTALLYNDTDKNPYNGGTTRTADSNLAHINDIIEQLNQMYTDALGYKATWEEKVGDYQTIYDNAVEVFESYLPEEDQLSDLDKSDLLEEEFRERINALRSEIEDVNTITSAINNTVNSTYEAINEITDSSITPPDVPPVQPGQYNYYIGEVSYDDLDKISTYNINVPFNRTGVKPETIIAAGRYNVLVWPASWGTPTFYTDVERVSQFDPYSEDELGLELPKGNNLICSFDYTKNSTVYVTWPN